MNKPFGWLIYSLPYILSSVLSSRLTTGDKALRVHHYHQNTMIALRDLICAAGLTHPNELGPEHILRRVSRIEVRALAALYKFMQPGQLLDGIPEHAVFQSFWADARSDSFGAPDKVMAMRRSKSI